MKLILSLVLVLVLVLEGLASERVTLSITITNLPSNNDTLTVNASTRTNKTTVAVAAYEVLIGAAIGAQTTNLWNHIASYPLTGPLNIQWVATNNFLLVGQAGNVISASASGTWATLTLSTQTVTSLQTVRVPISGEATSAARTNSADGLINGLFNSPYYGQVVIVEASPPMTNFVNRASVQTITGAKTFTNSAQVWTGGYVTNVQVNAAQIRYITNNAPLKFYTSGSAIQYGIAADANGIPSIYYINGTDNLATPGNYNPADQNILNALSADLRYGRLQSANAWTALNTFTLATGTFTNTTQWNPTIYGNTTFYSDLRFTRYDLTSLANGNNAAIPVGTTNVYIKIGIGPTAAFAINGIVSGSNGRYLIIENATGQAMTIAHESGTDPTAANRIVTMSGADVSSAGNAIAHFIYDSNVSRWKMIAWEIGGGGGGVTGTGTAGYLAKFTGTSSLGNSIASESGYTITHAGNLVVATNISSIRGVSYTWPSSQGAASTFLGNNGSGTLSWSTAGTTINPTDNYIPYRSNATTFGDSPFYQVGTTNVAIDSKIVFGPGTTNDISRVGEGLQYRAASSTAPYIEIAGETTGDSGKLEVINNLIGLRPTGTAVGSALYDSGGNAINYFGNLLYSANVAQFGTEGSPWGDNWTSGSYYASGYFSGTNYSRFQINHSGTNGSVILNSESIGDAGTPRPIVTQSDASDRQVTATAAKTLTESSATLVVNIAVASSKIAGGVIRYTINADDSTDFQSRNGVAVWSAVNKAGTVTASITDGTTDVAASAGTLTVTWTAVANGNSVDLKANAVSSLTQTTLKGYYEMDLRGTGTLTVTP